MDKTNFIQCPTPRCVEHAAKYGSSVADGSYAKGFGDNVIAVCQHCGGVTEDGITWIHDCGRCKMTVAPGELVGLFVPHLCTECRDNVVEEERENGHVCRMCRKVYSQCCC